MSATTVVRRPPSGSLAELVDIILDKGLVIDAFVRVSLVGIELLTVDARVVVASVDTYLHFAEAVNRLDLRDLIGGTQQQAAEAKTQGALEAAGDKTRDVFESGAERVRAAFGGESEEETSEDEGS